VSEPLPEREVPRAPDSGSPESDFARLYEEHSRSIYYLCLRLLAEPGKAEDATHDVFLKAFRKIDQFRGDSSLKTWLYRIAIREALNHRRWLWRHHREQDSIDVEPGNGHASLEIEDGSSTPFDQAASHEVQQAVQQALLKVPQAFRSAVILRDLEGMSYEEVAEVLAVTVGTVKSRILRGRRMLREILDPLLRDPHSGHIQVAAPHKRKTVLHSTLFSVEEDPESSRTDTTGWAHSGKTGDAEGGV